MATQQHCNVNTNEINSRENLFWLSKVSQKAIVPEKRSDNIKIVNKM